MTDRRYAEWTPTRTEWALHRVRVALRWLLRPVWRLWRRIEEAPALVPLWERWAGVDYTGWTVRNSRDNGDLMAGAVGTVTGYTFRRRRRHYSVAFGPVDLLTYLPAPEHVELIPPPHG